jgi:hypothetical protein
MDAFSLAALHGEGMPLDVDVHLIPAHGDEPAHLHHDLRGRPGGGRGAVGCPSRAVDLLLDRDRGARRLVRRVE